MATDTVTPAPVKADGNELSAACKPAMPGNATVGTHPNQALLLARDASIRLEAMAKVLQREMALDHRGYACPRLMQDIIKLNSVVMTVLTDDAVAKIADLLEIVGAEATHG